MSYYYCPHLQRRNQTFYFRIAVPSDLQELLQCSELTKSLRTDNKEEATRRCFMLTDRAFQLFQWLRQGELGKDAKSVSKAYLNTALMEMVYVRPSSCLLDSVSTIKKRKAHKISKLFTLWIAEKDVRLKTAQSYEQTVDIWLSVCQTFLSAPRTSTML